MVSFAALYLIQGARELREEEIPYSEFLNCMEQQNVADAVITEQFIAGEWRPC